MDAPVQSRLDEGWAHLRAHRLPAAEQSFRDALRESPVDFNSHLGLGHTLVGTQRFEEAAGEYQQALRIAPDDADIYQAFDDLSRAMETANRNEDGLKYYELADDIAQQAKAANRAVILRYWGGALVRRSLFDDAAAKYLEALRVNPNDPDSYLEYNNFCVALEEANRHDDALAQYQLAFDIGDQAHAPNRTIMLRCWADALRRRQRFDDAATKCEQALRINPDDEDTYEGYDDLCSDLEAANRREDAVRYYQLAYEIGQKANAPSRIVILRRWGEALERRERFDDAAGKFQEALQINPDDEDTYERYDDLCRGLEAANRRDDALRHYQLAYEIGQKANAPGRIVILRRWGEALERRKQFDDAAAKFQEALQINPDDADVYTAYARLCRALERENRPDEAFRHYQLAFEVGQRTNAPNRVLAVIYWAQAQAGRKLFDDATANLQRALDIDPSHYLIYSACRELCQALEAENRGNDALRLYELACDAGQRADASYRTYLLRAWAQALLRRKRVDDAARKYEESLSIDTADYSRWSVLVEWGGGLLAEGFANGAAARFREATTLLPDNPNAYWGLGNALSELEDFDGAIEQHRKADERWTDSSTQRPQALGSWAGILSKAEQFDEAIEKSEQAAKLAEAAQKNVDLMWVYFNWANVLADCGRYRDAISVLDKAIAAEGKQPYPHHNKASYLWQLGDYKNGWAEWDTARDCYNDLLRRGGLTAERTDEAVDFANMLREVLASYEEAERWYKAAIDLRKDHEAAWAGLAILYQRWIDSDTCPTDVHARLGYAVRRARELLEAAAERSKRFVRLIALVDLHIETGDWVRAKDYIARAETICGDSTLRQGDLYGQRGLVHFRSEQYEEAVEHFRRALMIKPEDLTMRNNLGKALLHLKQIDRAQEEFARVLRMAPCNVDAMLGAARACIELADDGDADQYELAERYLSNALRHGLTERSSSKRLRGRELANVYYLRGYIRVKRFEADRGIAELITLTRARGDFQRCLAEDRNHPKASAAIENINRHLGRQLSHSLFDWAGPVFIFSASTLVFLLAQVEFLFHETPLRASIGLPAASAITNANIYIAITFGALVFMVAGLYLPKVLKLKVPGIELQKTSVDQASAPLPLDIGRFSAFRD